MRQQENTEDLDASWTDELEQGVRAIQDKAGVEAPSLGANLASESWFWSSQFWVTMSTKLSFPQR
jgi:hypothetical protein